MSVWCVWRVNGWVGESWLNVVGERVGVWLRVVGA